MIPVIPHFSNECLNVLKIEKFEWPKYNDKLIVDKILKIVVQINGKKRDLIETEKEITEEQLLKKVLEKENLTKYLADRKIKRKIYVPNKLINLII